jgi:hypothetical protein
VLDEYFILQPYNHFFSLTNSLLGLKYSIFQAIVFAIMR